MKIKPIMTNKKQPDNIELVIQELDRRIEALKLQYNLFFTGELLLPPEKERDDLEKRIRTMMFSSQKSPRVNLLLNNLASRFSLYNNMWLKRMNELETGVSILQRKKVAFTEAAKPKEKPKPVQVDVSLNSEDSFEKFFDNYSQIMEKKTLASPDKDTVINSLKMKLIAANLVDAKVSLGVVDGKLKIKLTGVQ